MRQGHVDLPFLHTSQRGGVGGPGSLGKDWVTVGPSAGGLASTLTVLGGWEGGATPAPLIASSLIMFL